MGTHDGHRERFRQRFLKTGLDGFEDHEALELLLYHAQPRINTNPVAHRLMDRFGSFDAVLDAPVDQLTKVEGVGPNTAILLKLIVPLGRRYMIERNRVSPILNSTEKAGKHLVHLFHAERDEVVYMLCLDSKFKLLSCKPMSRGSVTSANINIRKIVEHALETNAVSVIIAHNHISGVTTPSREDQEATRRIRDALKTVDITLADHIIIAGGSYVSMADMGEVNA